MSETKEPHGLWPCYSEEEIAAVAEVVRSDAVNYLAHGERTPGNPQIPFEREFAAFTNCQYAIAVFNGTVALDLALAGLGIGSHNGGSEHDEVIVTARTFIASVSAIVNAGANPVFVEVDERTENISAEFVAPALTENTRAVMCVHLNGWPCDMTELENLLESVGRRKGDDQHVFLIEDAAQAHNAMHRGRKVGSLGDVAAWSFCQDKIITTGGEGGMVTCNDKSLYEKMWSLKDHGKSIDLQFPASAGEVSQFRHIRFGTNFRMTNMQAAIGSIQLKKMPNNEQQTGWTETRAKNAATVKAMLAEYAGENGYFHIPNVCCMGCENGCVKDKACTHAWYKFNVFVRDENLPSGLSRDKLMDLINEQIAPLNCAHGPSRGVFHEPAFERTKWRPKSALKNTEKLGANCITFQVHPGAQYPERLDLPQPKNSSADT